MAEKYAGTKGLTTRIAINRLYELLEKAPLGGKEEEYFEEAKKVIENNLEGEIRDSNHWRKVKEKLTAKQLLFVLEGD